MRDWSSDVRSSDLPDVRFLPVRPGPADPVEAVAEDHVVARRDAQIADFKTDGPAEGGEPRLQYGLVERARPRGPQRRRQLEHHDVGRVAGQGAGGVLDAERLRPLRSAERRVGKAGVGTGRSRWWPYP